MICVKDLTMTYKSGKGIFDISMEITEGEVFGYLGPNGAGKTTTIRNLMGFVNADKGSCTINGLNCRNDADKIQKQLGYLAGEIAFFEDMNGKQFLDFMCQMRGTKDYSMRQSLLERFTLDPTQNVRKMSKGMKQKLGIVAAFMHDPAVYILDEPTSGLDPLMQNEFIELVKEEKARGKTILMSSHIFEEVDRTADRVGIIKDGRLVATEDINTLKATRRKVFSIKVNSDQDLQILQNSGLEIISVKDMVVDIAVKTEFSEFLSFLAKCEVLDINVAQQNLEQVFMKYYGKETKQ